MRENGTDRDVALLIVEKLNTIAAGVTQINDNLYVPHIITQPTNQEGAISSTVDFTVVANNVKEYQWQYKASSSVITWYNAEGTGYNTNTYTTTVNSSSAYNRLYRCKITGKDGSIIYTDIVQIVEPET